MRKQIRCGVFETNSSSVHSLAFDPSGMEKSKLKKNKDGYIVVYLGQFGREDAVYTTQEEKLSYLMTLIYYMKSSTDEFEDFWLFEQIEDVVCEYANAKGIIVKEKRGIYPYIDHQSVPEYGSIDIINTYDRDSLLGFIFNKYVFLKTGSD